MTRARPPDRHVDAVPEERGSRSNAHGDSTTLSPGLVSSVIICASLGSVPFSLASLLRILSLSYSKSTYIYINYEAHSDV